MRPGSSDRCNSTYERSMETFNPTRVSPFSHLRCHLRVGHKGPHSAPTGNKRTQWLDEPKVTV